jgi:hypothetical protein
MLVSGIGWWYAIRFFLFSLHILVSGTYGKQGKNYYTTGLHVFCTTYTVPVCYLLDFGIAEHITVHITVRGALPVLLLNIPGCELCWPMMLV